MKATVSEIAFMSDDWVDKLDQTLEIINLPTTQGQPTPLNLQVKVTGDDPPPSVRVVLNTFEPGSKLKGRGSMVAFREVELAVPNPKDMPRGLPANVTVYRRTVGKLEDFLRPDDRLEFATVARTGGTSDAYFRKPLLDKGWLSRGVGRQPLSGGMDRGNAALHQPAALLLFEAGGVEGVEAEVKPQNGLVVGPKGQTWGLLRSAADIFYYSGHGAFWDGALIEPNHVDWLTPEGLYSYWRRVQPFGRGPMDLDVLILAGCSVLYIDFDNPKNPYSQGRKWAKLLCNTGNDGGPLSVLLGYGAGKEPAPSPRGGKAPADIDLNGKPVGNMIALHMAKEIANGLKYKDYVKKWIDVNRNAGIYTAIGIDVYNGYRDALNPDKTRKL
jgi:hypothetical protein